MQRPDEILDSGAHQNGAKPLPLFRPEALLHQQQKSYGDIVLIRPLSLTLLTSAALVIIVLAGAFLLLGHYTEKARVSGTLLTARNGAENSNAYELRAELSVPQRLLVSIRPGTQLSLRCQSCTQPFTEPATVLQIASTTSPANQPADSPLNQLYKVTLSLSPRSAQIAALNHLPQTATPVEAEIPLERKPLIKWLFKPAGS